MKKVDCRGLACPQPVLETKQALEKPGVDGIIVLVDNPGAKENVRRFAASEGYRVRVAEEMGVFQLRIEKGQKGPAGEKEPEGQPSVGLKDFTVFIDSDSLGRGSEELGKILMRSFLQTLEQSEARPKKIILINSGVMLACEGSEVLEDLREFSGKGIEILSCGTCLDFFKLKGKIRVGRISNMYEILDSLNRAGRVLKV